MSIPAVPYGSFTLRQLIEVHNTLALERGVEPIARWRDGRCRLVQRVAILRTKKPLPAPVIARKPRPKRRKQPIRDAIMEALAFVSHYENVKTGERISKKGAASLPRRTLFSVGLPYPEVAKRVLRKHPHARISGIYLRLTASMVRQRRLGFEHCELPQKRPHGMEKPK